MSNIARAEGEASQVGAEIEHHSQSIVLSSLSLQLPNEPVKINDQPYNLVPSEILAIAVNTANSHGNSSNYPVHGVTVEFGDTLPAALATPKDRSVNKALLYDDKTKTVTCTVPGEVVRRDEEPTALVSKYEAFLNGQLHLGLLQSLSAREAREWNARRYKTFWRLSALAGGVLAATMMPELVQDQDFVDNTLQASIGAGGGLGVSLFTSMIYADQNGFTYDGKIGRISRKAQRKRKNGVGLFAPIDPLRNIFPVLRPIELVSVESEPEDIDLTIG